ncbi:hypothetical protein JCM5350_007876, partial [Sporobolomyces pararoseus]
MPVQRRLQLGKNTYTQPSKRKKYSNFAILGSFGVQSIKLVGRKATQARTTAEQQLDRKLLQELVQSEDITEDHAYDAGFNDWSTNDYTSFNTSTTSRSDPDKYANKLAADAALRNSERPLLYQAFRQMREETKAFTAERTTTVPGLECKRTGRARGGDVSEELESNVQEEIGNCKQKKWTCTAIGFQTRYKISIHSCSCHSLSCQLMYQGYIGSSPRQPTVVFEISLIRYLYHQWRATPQGMEGFAAGLLEYHAEAGMRTKTRFGNDQLTRLHQQAALDEYRQLQEFET